MLLKSSTWSTGILLMLLCVVRWESAVGYKSEVEITPSPLDVPTTKKSGFFGGIKKFFRGSPTTTTTTPPPFVEVTTARGVVVPQAGGSRVTAQKPPPLVLPHAPLEPLGPRPDTPPSSPVAGSQQQPPQWPQPQAPTSQRPPQIEVTVRTTQRPAAPQQRPAAPGQPAFPPGFAPYQPPKSLPSGIDLSYSGAGARPQSGGRPSHGLAAMTSTTTTTTSTTTTTTTTTPKPTRSLTVHITSTSTTQRSPTKEDFPALPVPRRPSVGSKEDVPILPTPPRPPSPAPPSPSRPSSPSAWDRPLSTPVSPTPVQPSTPPRSPPPPHPPGAPAAAPGPAFGGIGDGKRVSFVPHKISITTVRPGFESAGGSSLASDAEIAALTEALYSKETNSQLKFMHVNPQGKTRSIDSTDEAPKPLLEVDEKAFESATVAKMRLLLNNYEMDANVNEYVSPNERKEENDFLDSVMATNVMRHAMLFLQNKGLVSSDPKTHRDLVKELWFTQYSRGNGKIGSSGFEHVFVNEVKNGTIIGLHNWVYFYEEEKAGRLDYKGYLNQLDLGTKAKVMKIRFTHNDLNKPVNTLFIGTSPEFELALYTVCFKLRADRSCPVSMDNNKFNIVTYSWRYRGKSLVGSAYPEI